MIASNGGTNCLISLLRQNPSSRSSPFRAPFLLRCNPRFPDELPWPDAIEGRAVGFVRIRLVHRSRTNLDVAPGCYVRPRAIGTNTFTADFCRGWLFIKRTNQPAKLGGRLSRPSVLLHGHPRGTTVRSHEMQTIRLVFEASSHTTHVYKYTHTHTYVFFPGTRFCNSAVSLPFPSRDSGEYKRSTLRKSRESAGVQRATVRRVSSRYAML